MPLTYRKMESFTSYIAEACHVHRPNRNLSSLPQPSACVIRLIYIIAAVAILAELCPLCCHDRQDSYLESMPATNLLKSDDFLYALGCGLGISIPVSVHVLVDYFTLKAGLIETQNILFDRLILVLSLVAVAAIMLSCEEDDGAHVAEAYVSAVAVQTTLVYSAFASVSHKYVPAYFTAGWVIFICFLFNSAMVLKVYYPLSDDYARDSIIAGMHFLSGIIFIVLGFLVLVSVLKRTVFIRTSLSVEDVQILVYTAFPCVSSVSFWAVARSRNQSSVPERTPDTATTYFYMMIVYSVMMLLLPDHLARHAIATTSAKLETKRAVVRSLKESLTVPLHAAKTSIHDAFDKIAKLIQACTNTVDMTAHETTLIDNVQEIMASVNASCEAVSGLLSDMGFMEKMEAGIFSLELTVVPLRQFVVDAIAPFHIEAVHKSLQLTVVADIDSVVNADSTMCSYCGKSTTLRQSQTINMNYNTAFSMQTSKAVPQMEYCAQMDVVKMTHVLRNFVSNAIKFTPNGGQVQITMQRLLHPPQHKSSSRNLRQAASTTLSTPVDSARELSDDICHCEPQIRPCVPPPPHHGHQYHYHHHHHEQQTWVRLSCTDSGAGIDPANIKRLFNEVVQFRANELQRGGGSGFGLRISKIIADLHGFPVSVHSNGEGTGSTFSVDVPVFCRRVAPNVMNSVTRFVPPPPDV